MGPRYRWGWTDAVGADTVLGLLDGDTFMKEYIQPLVPP